MGRNIVPINHTIFWVDPNLFVIKITIHAKMNDTIDRTTINCQSIKPSPGVTNSIIYIFDWLIKFVVTTLEQILRKCGI